MYGHTAVYHKASSTIYVYGGYVYKGDQWSISHDLYAYDIINREWNLLAPEVLSEVGVILVSQIYSKEKWEL